MKFAGKIFRCIIFTCTVCTSARSQTFTIQQEAEFHQLNEAVLNPKNVQLLGGQALHTLVRGVYSRPLLKGYLNAEARVSNQVLFIDDQFQERKYNNSSFRFDAIELYYQYSKKQFTFLAGRKKMRIGTGYIASPSDIIVQPPSPADPEDRLYRINGADLLQMSCIREKDQFDLFYLPDTRQNTRYYFTGHSFAVRYYRSLSPFEITAITRMDTDGNLQVAFNSAVTIGEKLELHTDNMYQQARDYPYPPEVLDIVQNKNNFRLLAGGQWSPVEKFNVVMEYLHFTDGYTNDYWNDFHGMGVRIAGMTRTPGMAGTLAKSTLAALYNYKDRFYKRDYLFIRLYKKLLLKKLDAEWISYVGLNDGGSLNRLGFYYTAHRLWSGYIHIQRIFGMPESSFSMFDYGQTLRAGVKLKF